MSRQIDCCWCHRLFYLLTKWICKKLCFLNNSNLNSNANLNSRKFLYWRQLYLARRQAGCLCHNLARKEGSNLSLFAKLFCTCWHFIPNIVQTPPSDRLIPQREWHTFSKRSINTAKMINLSYYLTWNHNVCFITCLLFDQASTVLLWFELLYFNCSFAFLKYWKRSLSIQTTEKVVHSDLPQQKVSLSLNWKGIVFLKCNCLPWTIVNKK